MLDKFCLFTKCKKFLYNFFYLFCFKVSVTLEMKIIENKKKERVKFDKVEC